MCVSEKNYFKKKIEDYRGTFYSLSPKDKGRWLNEPSTINL